MHVCVCVCVYVVHVMLFMCVFAFYFCNQSVIGLHFCYCFYITIFQTQCKICHSVVSRYMVHHLWLHLLCGLIAWLDSGNHSSWEDVSSCSCSLKLPTLPWRRIEMKKKTREGLNSSFNVYTASVRVITVNLINHNNYYVHTLEKGF